MEQVTCPVILENVDLLLSIIWRYLVKNSEVLICQSHLIEIYFISLSSFIFRKGKVLKYRYIQLNRTKYVLERDKDDSLGCK